MKTVLLLGAGASRAEAEAQGIPKMDLPPTDNTFFQYCIDHSISKFGAISTLANQVLGFDLQLDGLSAEFIFNLSYSQAVQEKKTVGSARLLFKELTRLFQQTIAKSTDIIRCDSVGGVYTLMGWAVENTKIEDLNLVTFNYDLVAEKALSSIKSKTGESTVFDFATTYQVHMDQILPPYPETKDEGFRSWIYSDSIPIIKLHGSLNWLNGVKGEYSDLDPIQSKPDKLFLYQGKKIFTNFKLDLTSADGFSTETFSMLPLIVPPVYDKSRYFPDLFRTLWLKARDSIEFADRIIFLGYSLPPSDLNAHILLAKGLANRRKQQRVDIIDLNPDVCQHYTRKLGISSLNYYKSVSEFVTRN